MTKNLHLNTFLRILTVFIIGYFVFDLLFGIVTGNFGMSGSAGGASGHHGASSGESPSYSFDMLTNALLILLLKLMLVLFLVVLIAGATKWIKLIWTSTGSQKQKPSRHNSIEFNSLLIIIGSIFSLLIFFSILKAFNSGGMANNLNTSLNYTFSNYTHPKNFSIDLTLGGFINILLYIISILLGIEVFLHLKKHYMTK
jgi:hypothetical protein